MNKEEFDVKTKKISEKSTCKVTLYVGNGSAFGSITMKKEKSELSEIEQIDLMLAEAFIEAGHAKLKELSDQADDFAKNLTAH